MIDNYGRKINYLRLSVTELCNLRCKYCMPKEGVEKKSHEEILRIEEMLQVVEAASELGINKIRITGGEPLVKRGIINICKGISSIKGIEEVCITTNGVLLKKYAKDLKEAGVNRLNISIDTLNEERYRDITRQGELKDALAGLEEAEKVGFDKIKLNVVLAKGFNDDEIQDFVNLTKEKPIEVRFIELMPIGEGIGFNRSEYISSEEILKRLPELEFLDVEEGVAKLYKLPNAKGRVGLISPMSCEFCDRCNKIRVTSDGKIKPCLHSNQEISLKGKTEEEMKELIKKAILEKPEERDIMDKDNPSKAGRDMNQIGG